LNLLYCAEAGRGLRARFLLHVRCDFIKPVDQPTLCHQAVIYFVFQ